MDWHAMAAPWLQVEGQTDAAHAPVLHGIMERAGLLAGQRVFDIGPGAGISLIHAAQAVGPDGHVTGVEIAPPFAARARERVPDHVQVVVGDGQDYSFEGEAFDAAISLFGVMFFRDSVAAFRNMKRALKPGCVLTFACWGPPQKNPWFSMPARVASEVFGPGQASDPDAPGPMRFGDADRLHAILGDAGLSAEIATVDLFLTPDGTPEAVADLMMRIGAASGRMKAAEEAGQLTNGQKDELRDRLTQGFAEMVRDGAVRPPANIHFVQAAA